MKRTPLKRRNTSLRQTALRRGGRLAHRSRTNSKQTRRAAGPTMGDLRELLIQRAGYRCEAFGCPISLDTMHAHHRLYRSRGGKDEIANLVALCGDHHVPWAHNKAFESVSRGFAIPAITAAMPSNPSMVPVVLHDGRRVFLHTDGTYWGATEPWNTPDVTTQPTQGETR